MAARSFFPRGLDPVLDGGVGDEDPVVAPQVPTGGLIRQAVLSHQPDGQSLDAAGVQALGQGQVGQIDAEAATAAGAAMFGVGDDKIDGAVRARVAQVVQRPRGNRVAASAVAATAAPPRRVVAAAALDTWPGKVLDPGNALGDVGDVLAWTNHGSPSVRNCPPLYILGMPLTRFR